MPRLTLQDLRRDLEEYGVALADEDYRNSVGLADDVDTSEVHERFEHVHSPDALAAVKRALAATTDPAEARRLRRLEMDVFGALVGVEFAEEDDRLTTEATRATVTVDGHTVRWREVGDRVRNEDDRGMRRKWKAADDVVAARFLPREESLETRARAFIAAQGYPDDATRWQYGYDILLAPLDARMRDVLAATDALYSHALDERLRRVEGIPLREAEGHDLAHLMRAKAFDAYFHADRLVPEWHRVLRGLGLDPTRMPNVTLDMEDRPAKTDRAFVLAARVPQDVRLVTKPGGGVDDWRALFHEGAHALHYALTDGSLPYEDRYLGEGGVTESYAFLFEHLFENPRFLAEVAPDLTGDALADYLAYCGLDKLMGVRDYAASLTYDRWASTAPLEAQPARYVEIMTDAMKVPANPLHYLDTDGFDGVWYLRAWMLEIAHRAFLEREFGREWWRHEDAGAHLARLFRRGESLTVESIADELGLGELTMDAVIEDARRLLGENG